ncbi:PREDICTED: metallo-beta-lactamase domain-containing protein 1-like [Priapulus caudatus]|uniref:Metallo-beta-lactamase domain-containing protein 1 n=1 Tax=Priapulus caudatus TaxID=37621 RepID=A0ABM1ENM7_PRICU|nr:PREDICTED: metallo-beta-lactamase domain-containing protein 1-like [Priapulus caudatus]
MKYRVHVLKPGYSEFDGDSLRADGTITLLKGRHNIMVDCGSPWDEDIILTELEKHKILPNGINFMVCTHGHTDHAGNLNLFQQAVHINGDSICKEDCYTTLPFLLGKRFFLDDEHIEIIKTPGHTSNDISVIVRDVKDFGTIVIAGDLFEKEGDIENPTLWMMASENVDTQRVNRVKVLKIADYIVPGHGQMFKVTEEMRNTEESYLNWDRPDEGELT